MEKRTEKVNLCQQVYDHVKEQLLSLRFRPGEKITEAMLAEELQISRTPIREGLRLLARDGVIRLYPNRFAEVTVFSPKDISDLGALRISLDLLAAKLAVFHGSNADFSRLQKLAQECNAAMARGDIQERARLDCDFHLLLTQVSQNPFLYDFQKELYTRVQMIQILRYSQAPQVHFGGASHGDIVEALLARDKERVISTVKSHLVSFYRADEDLPENFFETL